MGDRIRQVSAPVFNVADGHWYNRERILEPDGQGSYFVRDETVCKSLDGDSSTGLPEPWQGHAENDLRSLIPAMIFNTPQGRIIAGARFAVAYSALARNENPLTGTVHDVPFNSWRATDRPWDYSRLHPFDIDPDPQVMPDRYSTSVRRRSTVAD